MKVLVVLGRDPGGRQSGRKAVIATIIQTLLELGHELDVAIVSKTFSSDERDPRWPTVPFTRFESPSLFAVAANSVRFLAGGLSLNESLYFSRRLQKKIELHVAATKPDLIVCDMIRTFPLVENIGVPIFLDLDDLLSERYAKTSKSKEDQSALLGYFGQQLPTFLTSVLTRLATFFLKKESRTLRRREIAAAQRADFVSLVAKQEADLLSKRSSVNVLCLPMAIATQTDTADLSIADPWCAVTTGGLDYHANVVSLRWFNNDVLPTLKTTVPLFRLDVVGFASERDRREFASDQVTMVGYVDNIQLTLSQYRMFVAPITSGTGIKTKVLEAMAAGLPVIATPEAVRGLPVTPGHDFLLSNTAAEFAANISLIATDQDEAMRIAENGRAMVEAHFAPDVLQQRWREALSEQRINSVQAT